jgi:GT2 family glycosyltransferase
MRLGIDMRQPIEVAVLIVCFNGREYLSDCLGSVIASDDGDIHRRIIVIDNASTDGSADFIAQSYPQIDLLKLPENRGFAGGNNAGWEYVHSKYPATKYLALLNQDTIVQTGWLGALVDHLEGWPTAAAAQAKIFLYPQQDRLNTAGNCSHYLGFGFTTGYNQTDAGQFDEYRQIDFPSGAACLLRCSALERVGLFDDVFFLYLEDAELGWKLRQLAYKIHFVPTSVVFHKYQFNVGYRHYFYLERNRWYLLAKYYKLPTLILLTPAIFAMEIGQLLFAVRHGIVTQKMRAVAFFFCPKNILRLIHQRNAAQRRRLVGDRAFTRPFISVIDFPELKSPLLKIANPILSAYWRIVRRLMFW